MNNPINLDLKFEGQLASLVAILTQRGIKLDAVTKWETLTQALPTHTLPRPAAVENILDKTPEELADEARILAADTAHNSLTSMPQELQRIREQLDAALMGEIRANANQILTQLRPAFDQAADALRAARELGVNPTDTIETLFEADKPVRMAWLNAQTHAKSLDGILLVRQELSVTAGVPPVPLRDGRPIGSINDIRHDVGSGVDWSVTITDPGDAGRLAPYNPKAPWQRWLQLAPKLKLVDVETIPSGNDILYRANPDLLAKVTAEAQRRAHAA